MSSQNDNSQGIFDELAGRPIWLPYILEWNETRQKHDKIPNNGYGNVGTTAKSWLPLDKAVELVERHGFPGVTINLAGGIELDGWTLVGLDYDIVTDDFVFPLETYAERSPSGTGVRAFAWLPAEWAAQFKDTVTHPPGCDHCEVYVGTAPRHLTVTGQALNGHPIARLESLGDSLPLNPADAPGSAPAAPLELVAGKLIDLARHNLNAQQKHLVAGTGNIDRSAVLHGLAIRLIDNGESVADVLETILKTGPLWAYCLSHREGNEDKALQFAKDEVARAYSRSKVGMRARLAGFNEKWAAEEPKMEIEREPEIEEEDDSRWGLDTAPEVYAAYCDWYMQNARLCHPAFAAASADLFFQACAGWNIKSPSGLRANLWEILLARSAGGKGAIPELADEGVFQLRAKGIFPAIGSFQDSFSSGQAMWGHLMNHGQAIWFHPELAEHLANIGKAEQGILAEKRETILKLSDCATKRSVPPPVYALSTQGKYKLQPINFGYFAIFGTGVLGDIRAFTDTSTKSGLLNRFEPTVVLGRPTIGNSGGFSPLPKVIFDWAKKTFMKSQAAAMTQHSRSSAGKAIVMDTYGTFDDDWRAAMAFEQAGAERNPGVFGRYAEKAVKRAMIYGFAAGTGITEEGFAWGLRAVKERLAAFERHFALSGGGAKSSEDALCRGFMQAFAAKKMVKKHAECGYLVWRDFSQYGGAPWRECRNVQKQEMTLSYLKNNGFIRELDEAERKQKGARSDARAFTALHEYA